MSGLIDLNILPLETLAEMANEAAEQAEKNARITVSKAVDAGRYLIAAKEQVEPGKWLTWVGKNWNYTRRTASTYMKLAEHGKRFPSADYKSIREAMTMIAVESTDDEKEPDTPRAERKTGQVEVVEPDPVGQTAVQAEPEDKDDDPTPDPPTIRTTAKGSEKAKEADKPKTQPIKPEILDEPEDDEPDPIDDWFASRTLEDVACKWLGDVTGDAEKKSAAKHLRKLADKLDPPKKFSPPTVEEVAEYCAERKNGIDAEAFIAHYSKQGWKSNNGIKLTDWRPAVITWEKRDKEKGNTNGRRTESTGTTNTRPPVARAKINYK